MDPVSQLGLDKNDPIWSKICKSARVNAYRNMGEANKAWAQTMQEARELFTDFAQLPEYAGVRQEAEAMWARTRNYDLIAVQKEPSLSFNQYLAWIERMDNEEGRQHQWLCAYTLLAEGIVQGAFAEIYNNDLLGLVDDSLTVGLHFFLSIGYSEFNPDLYRKWCAGYVSHGDTLKLDMLPPIAQEHWINTPPWSSTASSYPWWQLFFYGQRMMHRQI